MFRRQNSKHVVHSTCIHRCMDILQVDFSVNIGQVYVDTDEGEASDVGESSDDASEDVNYDEDDTRVDLEDMDTEVQSTLPFVLLIFFRIISHFRISNNATSRILAFIYFLLGTFFKHIYMVINYCHS